MARACVLPGKVTSAPRDVMIALPMAYENTVAMTPTTKPVAVTTSALAAITRARRGSAVNVTRMVVCRNSWPMTRTPSTPIRR